ncbi:MAG: signal peptidase I [Oscillospiraceae bacterium]|nr:signal peptidase I [Oscillospiraceae bacterium]
MPALRLLLLILCGALLGIKVYLANANSLVGEKLPMPFGTGAAVVLSGSMEPTFSQGDLIIVNKADSFAEGDIVVFGQNGSLVVHRIVDMDGEMVTTRGDANNTNDQPIPVSSLRGRVSFWIPGLGHVVSLLKTPIGTISLLAAAIALVEIPFRRKKQQDDEERRKIIEEIKRLKDQN